MFGMDGLGCRAQGSRFRVEVSGLWFCFRVQVLGIL